MARSYESFSYDGLGRLTQVQIVPPFNNQIDIQTSANVTYSLDPLGNRTLVQQTYNSLAYSYYPQVVALPKLLQGDFANSAMMVLVSSNPPLLIGWGKNTTGALANGTLSSTVSPMQFPQFDPNTTLPSTAVTNPIVDWAFTNANLYVVYTNGWVYSAGANDYGQLGVGDTVQRPFLKRIDYFVANGITVTGVWAAGSQSATQGGGCVYFQTSAGLYACGANAAGNLGNASNPTSNILTPAPCAGVPTNTTVTNVVIGAVSANFSTYVLCANGTLWVAGYNGQGQLGTNSTNNVTGGFVPPFTNPWPASNFAAVKSMSATGGGNGGSALLLDVNGVIWGSGYNAYGQVFPATTSNITTFNNVNVGNFVQCGIGGGSNGYSYAIDSAGGMTTWGYNGANNLFLNNTINPASGFASFVPDAVSQAFFPRGDALGGSGQLIILTTGGRLAYAGTSNGLSGVSNALYPGAYYYLPMPASVTNGTESIVNVFVHGTGSTQRLFILTDLGNLYASGNNTDSICTRGRTSNSSPPSVAWYFIDFSELLFGI